jgi:diphthine synthase
MLSLIGLGLFDEKDLTIRGLERAKNADKIYVEFYTSKWHGDVKKLEKNIGKKIEVVDRKNLEEESNKIIEEAKRKKIVIFVLGDPLVATTHISLLSDAKKAGVRTEVVHNASIYSAVGETGLHLYKFGRTVTIPYPEKTESTDTVADAIEKNLKMGLHTLLLLDVISEKEKYMRPKEGIETLLKMKKIFFTENTEIVVFARAGNDKPLIVYGKVKDLIEKDFGEPPFVIIIPGKLHFTEKEYLEMFRVKE